MRVFKTLGLAFGYWWDWRHGGLGLSWSVTPEDKYGPAMWSLYASLGPVVVILETAPY